MIQERRRIKPFVKFYSMLDKRDRVQFFKEAFPLLGIARSSFYYKVSHGNLYPSEAAKIKHVLEKYGCSEKDLLSLGVVD